MSESVSAGAELGQGCVAALSPEIRIKKSLQLEFIQHSAWSALNFLFLIFLLLSFRFWLQEQLFILYAFSILIVLSNLLRIYFARKILASGIAFSDFNYRSHAWCVFVSAFSYGVLLGTGLIVYSLSSMGGLISSILTAGIVGTASTTTAFDPFVKRLYFLLLGGFPLAALAFDCFRNPGREVIFVLCSFIIMTVYLFSQSARHYRQLYRLYEAELQLVDEKQQLQTVIDNVPGFMICFDEKLRVSTHSEAACLKMGIPLKTGDAAESIGGMLGAEISSFLNAGINSWSKEVELEKHSVPAWFLLSFERIASRTAHVIVTGSPIDELKDMQKALLDQRAKARFAAKMASLGEMAGGIAHEINNPLGIIDLLVERMRLVLSDVNEPAKSELRSLLEKTSKAIVRIVRIIKGLKNFARPGDGDSDVIIPLSAVVRDTLEFCEQKFRASGIEFIVEPLPEEEVLCKPVQISQVLLNLLNNAFDAVKDAEIKKIQLAFVRSGLCIDVKVFDSGPGVPESIREKIFEPFFTTKDPNKGTGLGLSISRSIMEYHKGQVFLGEAEDAGTSFVMRLPVVS